jgi:RNA polymerase sigma-70 factor, ECF subfamily
MTATEPLRPTFVWSDFLTFASITAEGRVRNRSYHMTRPTQEPESELEARLISRIAGGDDAAFSTLYERFSASLYGMAFRMMNDAREAEDVLQEGFTYIWRKAASYDSSRSTPFAWAVMIVRHKAIDRLRVRQRQERLHDKVTTESSFFQETDETSADQPALRERGALVRSALRQIPEEQRQALELSFFGGLTHEQIAERLATPLGTIKARIRRGLLRLRDCLKEGL